MTESDSIIDEICARARTIATEIPFLVEPLTAQRGRAYILQHILRNRLLSGVIRPAWISRCPDLEIVCKTIDQMRQELVQDDEIDQPHTTLLRAFGRNIGLSDAAMAASRPVPLVEVAFNVWENIARTRHWVAGWLSSSVDEFIAFDTNNSFQPEVWKRTFKLSDDQVFFLTYHARADDDHAGAKVWEPINRHIGGEQERADILGALTLSLVALKIFYQGVCELGDQL
jgi:pyrroloquinoline quinone (PQQ) biosynthesis protein C